MRPGLTARGAGWNLVVAVLLAVGGCDPSGGDRAASPNATAPTTTPLTAVFGPSSPAPTRDTPELPSSADFREVCDGNGFRGSAAYSGRGPHPIRFADLTPANRDAGIGDLVLPPRPGGWETRNDRAVQLVACITMSPGPKIRDCDYSVVGPDVSVPLSRRVYTIDIRSARTGRRIGPTATVRGAEAECEVVIETRYGAGTPQYSTLSAAQLRSTFARWIEGRR